jgi:conjugative transfer signal peptidase TraF
MSRAILAAFMAAGVGLIAAPAAFDSPPRLVWNASASAPLGLYRIEPADNLDVGDLVLVTPTGAVAALLAERGYLAPGVPLLKRLAALAGQTVCRAGDRILIDGRIVATAREMDRAGRPLPRWQSCQRLSPDLVFLLNQDAPDSLDGRYFGPTPASALRGRAVLLRTSMERRS